MDKQTKKITFCAIIFLIQLTASYANLISINTETRKGIDYIKNNPRFDRNKYISERKMDVVDSESELRANIFQFEGG